MARTSKPLIVSPEDIEALKEMLSTADPKMQERIQIILACANEPSNKKVSAKLNADEHKVAKWKGAYQKFGIDGLRPSHGGGRKAKATVDNLEGLVLSKLDEPGGDWTIHSLAESLGCSDYQISKVLKEKGVSLARKHSWTYATLDTVQSSDVEVVGIYLSHDSSIVATCYSHYGMVTEPGVLETRDRDFWERLMRSPVQVSLPNAIMEHGKSSSGNGSPASHRDYLRDFIPATRVTPDVEYHLFVLSRGHFHYSESLPANASITSYTDAEEWERQIHSWLGARTTGIRLYEFEALQRTIRSHIDEKSGHVQPFSWKKLVRRAGSREHRIAFVPYEETMGWDAAEEGLPQLPGLLSKDGKLKCGLIAFVADEKKVICKTIESSGLAQPDQFDFSSKEGLMGGLDKIEAPIVRLRDQAGIAVTDMYLDAVKKN